MQSSIPKNVSAYADNLTIGDLQNQDDREKIGTSF